VLVDLHYTAVLHCTKRFGVLLHLKHCTASKAGGLRQGAGCAAMHVGVRQHVIALHLGLVCCCILIWTQPVHQFHDPLHMIAFFSCSYHLLCL
jgi:hypothetical protein